MQPSEIERLLSTEQCKRMTPEERHHIRNAIESASMAHDEQVERTEWHSTAATAFFMASWVAAFTIIQWRVDLVWPGSSAGFSWRTIVETVLGGAFWFCVFALVLVFALKDETETATLRGKATTLVLFATCTGAVATLLIVVSRKGPIAILSSLAVTVASLASAIIVIWLGAIALVVLLDQLKFGPPRLDPRDELVRRLAEILLVATGSDHMLTGWRTTRYQRRQFVKMFCYAAREIEEELPLVAGRFQYDVRASLRELGVQIAATLTRYARDVAIGGPNNDLELANNIARDLLAASYGRLEEIASGKESKARQRILRRFGIKISVSALLGVAGIWAPTVLTSWIGVAGPQLRIALLAAAALSLIDTPKSATDRVAQLLKGK